MLIVEMRKGKQKGRSEVLSLEVELMIASKGQTAAKDYQSR